MKLKPVLMSGLAVLLLASCNQQQAPANEAHEARPSVSDGRFSYGIGEDVAGDYAPVQAVQGADWQLEHIFIAGPHSFEAWGPSGNPAVQSPVIFVFLLGDKTFQVKAEAFDLSEQNIRIEAESAETGAIRFEGLLDMDALATARRTLGAETVVLKGTLKVGNQSFNNLGLKIKTGG